MSEITGPIGPNDKKSYEQEYKQSADLFKRALDQYSKSDDMYQKAEFKHVMDKAMQILNETAHELMRKELESQNQTISKDYASFQKHPDDQDAIDRLGDDLERAKKSV